MSLLASAQWRSNTSEFTAALDIREGVEQYAKKEKLKDLSELIGSVKG